MSAPVWRSADLGKVIGPQGPVGPAGPDGITYTPSVSEEGIISWTNDGGKQNPQSVNIKGPKGETGDPAPAEEIIPEVDSWLEENFSNPDSPPLDRSLSSPHAAAPADIVGEVENSLNKVFDSDAENVDLDIADNDGNVIARLSGGHIRTKYFDSENITVPMDAEVQSSDAEEVDLDISDTDGNVVLRIKDGNLETKKFNSGVKPVSIRNTTEEMSDLDITDDSGNVIMRLANGELQTKKLDLKNPYFLPTYYADYLDAKCSRIKELLAESGGEAFIIITDQHFTTGNSHHSYKLIYHIAKECRINKVFCLGDMYDGVNEKYAKEYRDAIRDAIGGRCYMVAGNHEYFVTTEEQVQYGLTGDADDEIGNPLRRYFYVDNPKNKIRYIVLNAYKEGDTVATREAGYEQAQMDWLENIAFDVDSGWSIIILTHELFRVTSLYDSTLIVKNDIKAVMDEIDTFTTDGEIVCMMQGHTHVDAIKQTDGGIPIMITCCDKYQSAGGAGGETWLAGRVPGTVTEQCFDVCVLDTTNRKLTAVRIGGFATDDPEQDAELYEIGERVINY